MLSARRVWILLSVEAIIAIVVAVQRSMMDGFWVFAGLMLATALIFAFANSESTKQALGLTKLRIGSYVSFILVIGLFTGIFSGNMGFPTIPSIILASVSAIFIWSTYYSFEPQRA